MKQSIVQEKSYLFAIKIVTLSRYLVQRKKEFVLSNQLLKSGTSIGANIEEALGGHSKKDFAAKLTIAYKEARETDYWLRILHDTNLIGENTFKEFYSEIQEILKMLGSIQLTIKKSTRNLQTRNS